MIFACFFAVNVLEYAIYISEKDIIMKKTLVNSVLLTLTALIWGTAFVAQSTGGDAVGPYTFNSIRSFIGAIVLIPVILITDRLQGKQPPKGKEKHIVIAGGIACGIVLCLASNLQQLGITLGDSVGKAGFLTACYIIIVPILSIFLKKRCSVNVWIGAVLALLGLYLLCIKGEFRFTFSDVLLLLCALVFSVHILVVDHFGSKADPVRMSCIQFLVCGILSIFPAVFFDMRAGFEAWAAPLCDWHSWIPILYAGVLSCGTAYTLQLVAQPKLNPTVASLIMSLESVFSVLAGWVLLGQALTMRELLGCMVMFAAIVIAQLPAKSKRVRREIG